MRGYIANHVLFPGLDVRQRLSVSAGYGAAELTIPADGALVDKTIDESGLRDRDIVVLSLTRDSTVIPNPAGARMLEAGDELLCFGKLDSLRDLVTERRRRRIRPVVQPLPTDPFSPATDTSPPA